MNDPINEKEVQQAIKSLENNKSTDKVKKDKVKNEFIKYRRQEIIKSIILNVQQNI